MTQQPKDWGIVMPFVSVTSRGGPHDDDSYVAGWEMAALHAHLLNAQPDQHEQNVLPANRQQADLVAMHTGYAVTFEEIPEAPNWLHATFVLQDHARAVRNEQRKTGMSVDVNPGVDNQVTHPDAVTISVVDGHLLCLNAQGDVVAAHAPGRWIDAKVNSTPPAES